MDEVLKVHSGNFTIQGYGQPAPKGRFIATYVVTEQQDAAVVELKRSTGQTFGDEHQAAEMAIEEGKKWLADHRPANPWEGKK